MLAGSAAGAAAQAFVPDRGEGAVTVMYQSGLVTRHLQLHTSQDAGRIESAGFLTDFSLGLGHKLAVSFGLPYIGSRYTGTKPHALLPEEEPLLPNFKTLDDGNFHSTLQDVRVELRYGLRWAGLSVAPFVTGIIPSHDYQSFSHAAAGRHLRELQVGVYAARVLDPWLPGGFFQAGYTHGFEQTIIDIPRQRSILTFEGGYFATSKLRVFGEGAWQVTHGGVDVVVSPRADFVGLEFIHHDQIMRTNMLDLGGGAAWTLSDRVDIIGSFTRTVWGINGHAQSGVLTVGMSYGIGSNKRRAASAASGGSDTMVCHVPDSQEGRLEKCVCLRK
jgi:hypothetical protein